MQFTRLTGPVGNVEGLDRLPRLGKIRLGIKKKSAKTGREYPAETDHFVCPQEVEDAFGKNPTVLRGMFPSNDPTEVYQEKLAMYGQTTGLKCHGDGTTALRRNEAGEWVSQKCPCDFLKTKENPGGSCTPQGHLKVMLPEVTRGMWGYYQITTHSVYARGGILGSLKHMLAMIGRVGFVPVKLFREPQEIAYEGKKKVHYILKFEPDLTTPQIAEMRSKPDLLVLPAAYEVEPALDENPKTDPVDVVVDEEEDEDEAAVLLDKRIEEMDDKELEAVQKALNARRTQTKPAETPKPIAQPVTKPTEKPATKTSQAKDANGMIAAGPWRDIIAFMDSHPDLATVKDDWKRTHSVDNVSALNGSGQQSLLSYMREQVGVDNFPF